ncbi:hypothetical protein FRIGORI9N_430040 [Frigoribacterium sp. 9N]|nr:hypothetical protein FRIGORI9N_430040 [Frigoribacterium sp. 9N]
MRASGVGGRAPGAGVWRRALASGAGVGDAGAARRVSCSAPGLDAVQCTKRGAEGVRRHARWGQGTRRRGPGGRGRRDRPAARLRASLARRRALAPGRAVVHTAFRAPHPVSTRCGARNAV